MNNYGVKVQDIKKYFTQGDKQIEVLKGITVNFQHSQTYAIMGVSGTGKSTFIHLLAGLDIPSTGNIYFNGQNLASLSPKQKRLFLNRSVGLVFQLPYLIRELSVLENIMIMGLIRGKDLSQCKNKARYLLKKIGLEEKADNSPSTLSGGEQQRIAILRAIFNEPAFLLADEPTGNLDEKTGKGIVDLLIDCHTEWNMGIIVSSHDTYVVKRMNTIFQLKDGLLIEQQL